MRTSYNDVRVQVEDDEGDDEDADPDDVQGSRGKAKQARETVWEAWGRKLGEEEIQQIQENQNQLNHHRRFEQLPLVDNVASCLRKEYVSPKSRRYQWDQI